MNKLLKSFLFILILSICSCNDPSETQDDKDITSNFKSVATYITLSGEDVYTGGYYTDRSNRDLAGYWKNDTWISLTLPGTNSDGYVTALFISGSDIYAAGIICYNTGEIIHGYWKNGEWNTVAPSDGAVSSIFISGSDVYAGGHSHDISGLSLPCYWKNGVQTMLPVTDSTKSTEVTSIYVSGNDVYAGGKIYGIACVWKNSTITELSELENYNSNLDILFVSDNNVYSASTYNYDYWKNDLKVELPATGYLDQTISSSLEVTSLFVSGSDVYIGGTSFIYSASIGGYAYVGGYFKNDTFHELPGVDPEYDTVVTSLFISGNDVYAGGFNTKDFYSSMNGMIYQNYLRSESLAGYWKNGIWHQLHIPGE